MSLKLMSFRDFLKLQRGGIPYLDEIIVPIDGQQCKILQEGKWIKGQFDSNIRIDNPTHGVGQKHAHIYGRNAKHEIGVVNFDGTASHGSKFKIKDKDAAALRKDGFNLRADNIVEWVYVGRQQVLLLG